MGLMNIRRMMMNSAPQEEPQTVTVEPSAIATFDANWAVPMKSVKVNIDPIQDLHGQESPYPAGGGKNIAYLEQGSLNMSTGAEEASTTRVRTNLIPVEQATNYIASSQNSGWSIRNGVAYDANKGYVSNGVYPNTSGKFVTNNASVKYVRFIYSHTNTSEACTPSDMWYQFEKGSTATAYAPYSNICPISGRTEVNVEHTGVNIWDEEWEVGDISTSSGQNTDASEKIRSKNYTPIKKGVSYTIVKPSGSGTIYILYYGGNKNYLSFESIGGSAPYGNLTIPTDAEYVRIKFTSTYGTTYHNDICINYPSNDHDYHPYSGQSINIQLGQTVYGGTLDVVSGVLTVDRAMVSQTGWYYSTITGFTHSIGDASTAQRITTISSHYQRFVGGWASEPNGSFQAYSGLIGVKDDRFSNSTEWMQYLADESVQFCYKLASPITVQLTPHEVRSYLGGNNVWADSGDTEVTYYTR